MHCLNGFNNTLCYKPWLLAGWVCVWRSSFTQESTTDTESDCDCKVLCDSTVNSMASRFSLTDLQTQQYNVHSVSPTTLIAAVPTVHCLETLWPFPVQIIRVPLQPWDINYGADVKLQLKLRPQAICISQSSVATVRHVSGVMGSLMIP